MSTLTKRRLSREIGDGLAFGFCCGPETTEVWPTAGWLRELWRDARQVSEAMSLATTRLHVSSADDTGSIARHVNIIVCVLTQLP